MEKHPATPSPVLPARELLADLLLELNQPAAALTEYKAVLQTDPNRFRSLLGEARAAKQAGDATTAHTAYQKLVRLSKPSGPEGPELAEAKAYLTNRSAPKRSRSAETITRGQPHPEGNLALEEHSSPIASRSISPETKRWEACAESSDGE